MSLKAAFSEVDITPPVGTHKIGWLKVVVSESVLDPIFVRIAVIQSGKEKVAIVQLDTLCIRWTQVADIRKRVEKEYGFPAGSIMVSATHNHAGPAVANIGDVKRDEAYIESMVEKIVSAFGGALENLQEAQIGFGSLFEFNISHNRRVVMRDGTVRTHGQFTDPEALYVEGPIDPEIAVIAVRGKNNALLGAIVNFACHPVHHGATGEISAGYPGVLASIMKSRGCPVTLFLDGASGNLSPSVTKDDAGLKLADDISQVLPNIQYRANVKVNSRSRMINLPYRKVTDAEIKGTVRGAQRFIDPAIYDREIPALVERIRTRKVQPAEVQVLFIDNRALAGIPAEYFVEHGLRIKEESYPVHALVAGQTNGMVGYVPTKTAFQRGGYETTFAGSSRMGPEAGDILADCAIELIKQGA